MSVLRRSSIGLERIEPTDLPLELVVSAVTMAEPAAGLAATAVALGLPLYPRHQDDPAGLSDLLEIVSV